MSISDQPQCERERPNVLGRMSKRMGETQNSPVDGGQSGPGEDSTWSAEERTSSLLDLQYLDRQSSGRSPKTLFGCVSPGERTFGDKEVAGGQPRETSGGRRPIQELRSGHRQPTEARLRRGERNLQGALREAGWQVRYLFSRASVCWQRTPGFGSLSRHRESERPAVRTLQQRSWLVQRQCSQPHRGGAVSGTPLAGELYAYGDAGQVGNYQAAWGDGVVIGAWRNHNVPNGGVTLLRDDGKNLNRYALPIS
jgi:hypothetical protein